MGLLAFERANERGKGWRGGVVERWSACLPEYLNASTPERLNAPTSKKVTATTRTQKEQQLTGGANLAPPGWWSGEGGELPLL